MSHAKMTTQGRLRAVFVMLACALAAILWPAPATASMRASADSRLGISAEIAEYTYRLTLRKPRIASGNYGVSYDFASDPLLRWKARWHYDFGGTEVYDIRARQWCPELGSFLSIDNYNFHDANSTLWGWPSQNPIRWRDPSGRDPFGGGEAVVESLWDASSADRQSWDYGRGLGTALGLATLSGLSEISAAASSGALLRFYDAARKLAAGITGGAATAASKTLSCSSQGNDSAKRAIDAARAACPGGDCKQLSELAKASLPNSQRVTLVNPQGPLLQTAPGVFSGPQGFHQAVLRSDGTVVDPLLNTTFPSIQSFVNHVLTQGAAYQVDVEGQIVDSGFR